MWSKYFLLKNLVKKNFGSKIFLGQKYFWVKKIFGSKNFWVKKFFGSQNFFGQQIFWVKIILGVFLYKSVQNQIQKANIMSLYIVCYPIDEN